MLAVADFSLRITVWSLTDRRCTYLRGPKHGQRGLAFSPEGGHLAVLEVRERGGRGRGDGWAGAGLDECGLALQVATQPVAPIVVQYLRPSIRAPFVMLMQLFYRSVQIVICALGSLVVMEVGPKRAPLHL